MRTILYIGISKGSNIESKEVAHYLVKMLSTHYLVHLLGDLFDKQISKVQNFYDLIIIQNSQSLVYYGKILRRLLSCPVLFVSETDNLNSYVAPFKNLFGVINIGGGVLSECGIPMELQLRLDLPVDKTQNLYLLKKQQDVCRIVYCPTGRSLITNDFKLMTLLRQTNVLLTIIADDYTPLNGAFPSFVEVLPRHSWYSAFKKAHLVVASGYDAVRAIALCKLCVVLGDSGLGGMVTPDNYDNLQSVYFKGRSGGYVGEMVPSDLLELEIKRCITVNNHITVRTLQKKVLSRYCKSIFDKALLSEINHILDISFRLKDSRNRFLLKPRLSSVFTLSNLGGKQYMMRGMICFGELDEYMVEILKQCDGTVSLAELILAIGCKPNEAEILWNNLLELWNEKLILFES